MGLRILPVNFFDQVTDLAVTPAAVTTLPVTNLQSNIRDRVWRSPNLDQQLMTGTFGGNGRRVSAWGVFPGTGKACLIGSKWRVELFSDAALATPVYDSGALDVIAFTGLGWGSFPWGAQPWGFDYNDRTARLAPLVKFFTAVYVGSFRITVTNGGAVDTPYFEARRFWLADYVEAPYTANLGAAPMWDGNSEQQRSIGGSLRRLSRAKWRSMQFEINLASESDRSTWSDLMYLADMATEIVVSLFPENAAPKLERDHTAMGSLKALNPLVWSNVPSYHTLQLQITES